VKNAPVAKPHAPAVAVAPAAAATTASTTRALPSFLQKTTKPAAAAAAAALAPAAKPTVAHKVGVVFWRFQKKFQLHNLFQPLLHCSDDDDDDEDDGARVKKSKPAGSIAPQLSAKPTVARKVSSSFNFHFLLFSPTKIAAIASGRCTTAMMTTRLKTSVRASQQGMPLRNHRPRCKNSRRFQKMSSRKQQPKPLQLRPPKMFLSRAF
jgi:hypothetical protein